MNIDRDFREAISEALRRSPLSRYQVAARMSELTDTDITKTMLDSWTAESKDQHRFPAIFLPAFCEAVECNDPLQILGKLVGVYILPGPEALRAEIHKIEEEITKQQNEKRKRMLFLKEMEGGAKLSEGQAEVLVPAGKTDHLVVAVVSIDAFSELVCGDKVHQLGKDRFPGIHAPSPQSLMRETGTSEKKFSNR